MIKIIKDIFNIAVEIPIQSLISSGIQFSVSSTNRFLSLSEILHFLDGVILDAYHSSTNTFDQKELKNLVLVIYGVSGRWGARGCPRALRRVTRAASQPQTSQKYQIKKSNFHPKNLQRNFRLNQRKNQEIFKKKIEINRRADFLN